MSLHLAIFAFGLLRNVIKQRACRSTPPLDTPVLESCDDSYAHFRDVHFPCPGRAVSVATNYVRPPSDSAILAAVEAKDPIRICESG